MALSNVIKIPIGTRSIAVIKKTRVISSAAFMAGSFTPFVLGHNEDSCRRDTGATYPAARIAVSGGLLPRGLG
jgi:hypothetical protein